MRAGARLTVTSRRILRQEAPRALARRVGALGRARRVELGLLPLGHVPPEPPQIELGHDAAPLTQSLSSG